MDTLAKKNSHERDGHISFEEGPHIYTIDGDANYLSNDQLYISNESASIFNLVRVWNIGQYLTPDEAAINATIECQYENYPVRTYGRVEIDYGTSAINGTFWWDVIESGYWFRIGVVSQDVSGKSVGNYYNVISYT